MIFLSPGVKTKEIDYSQYIGQISTSIVGMAGGAQKGPIDIATLCTSPTEFVETFGEPTIDDYGPISALMFLKQGNQLYYVRVATTSVALATSTHNSITVSAKSKGTYGNNIGYTITNINGKDFTMSVYEGTQLRESLKASLDPDSDKFLENLSSQFADFEVNDSVVPVKPADIVTPHANSRGFTSLTTYNPADLNPQTGYTTIVTQDFGTGVVTVRVEDPAGNVENEYTITFAAPFVFLAPTTEVKYLTGGDDGLPVTPYTVIGTSGSGGLQCFRNKETLDINIICAPGHWEDIVQAELIDIASTRYDAIAVLDPPQGLSVQDVMAYHNGTLPGTNYPEKALNSSYAALYYPWVQITNIYTQEKEWIPPSGLICGVYAYNDREGQPWFAPAGLNRGMIEPAIKVERDLTEGHRDALYGNDNAINPIINYKNNGIVVWGQRTLQRMDSALDRVNVRRLMLLIRKSIAATTAYLVFEQNDELTWRRFKGMVNPYLESIKNARGLYDYKVVMDETTVTDYYKDLNMMPGKVFIKPTKVAEFIEIDFILTSSGANFDEM